MSATITETDRAAAHAALATVYRDIGCYERSGEQRHVAECDMVAQAIADARDSATKAEHTACVELVATRCKQMRGGPRLKEAREIRDELAARRTR